MLRGAGVYGQLVRPDRPTEEFDGVVCNHGQAIKLLRDGLAADDVSSTCKGCMQRICPVCTKKRAVDGLCTPAEKVADESELAYRREVESGAAIERAAERQRARERFAVDAGLAT
jgi:hypothetical protein